MSDIAATIFLIIGATFILIAGVGLVRLPDSLCRAHALSKALTFGICIMLLAFLAKAEDAATVVKVLLAIGFQLLTIPLAGHIFALYAYKIQGETCLAHKSHPAESTFLGNSSSASEENAP